MKRKSKNKKLTLILVLVLLISVGYAALASNLKINGSSKVNAAKWNVYWDNIQITEGSAPADNDHKARITDSGKTQVEFSIELNEPGDYYEFTVDAVNNGTIDAMIAAEGISKGTYSDSNYTTTVSLPDSVSYTVTYEDGTAIDEKHLLAKKTNDTPTVETYKVRIEYKNDDSVDPEDLDNNNDHTYYFKFSVNYVQADNTAIESHPSAITYVTRQNEGQITPGDLVRIGDTENFYVISSNSEKTVLLAKYNLLVGTIGSGYNVTGTIPTSTAGYGLQSSEATGRVDGVSNYKGGVAFSQTGYWDDGNGTLLSPYNANGAGYGNIDAETGEFIPNPNGLQPYVYDSNSEIYWYISGQNGYVSKLVEMGAPSTIAGRLLTYEEAVAVQNVQYESQSIIFNGSLYWLGSALTDYSVLIAESNYSMFSYNGAADDRDCGVRPVIEIPTSEIR